MFRLVQPDSQSQNGLQLVSCLHGLLAFKAAQNNDLVTMESEIAQSFRAWPVNPLAVFLTGEKLAANGEWEKAADSLEKRAAGTDDEWLAQRLAQRAREFRDGKGSTKSLVVDARFLLQVVAHTGIRTARDPAARQRSAEFLARASSFGQEFLQKLPFVSGKAAPPGGTNGTETGAK